MDRINPVYILIGGVLFFLFGDHILIRVIVGAIQVLAGSLSGTLLGMVLVAAGLAQIFRPRRRTTQEVPSVESSTSSEKKRLSRRK